MTGKLTEYGFEFGPMTVTRLTEMPDGSVVIEVSTEHRRMEVYASPGGRSLRAFSGGFDVPMRGKPRRTA